MPSDPLVQKKRGRPRKDGATLPPAALSISSEAQQAKMNDAEVLKLIISRFNTLSRLAGAMIDGKNRAMIVSGAPGIGKTHTTLSLLEHSERKGAIRFKLVKGFMTGTMLYQLLWEYREANCVIVVDDCDAIFYSDDSVNLLKAALDTSERRIVSYRASNVTVEAMPGDDGDQWNVPNEFEFKGSMIFNTNIDFHAFLAGPRTRVTPHIQALLDRSFYLDMKLHGPRALALWIRHMLSTNKMLTGNPHNMTLEQSNKILEWLLTNRERIMPQLSLRSAVKAASLVRMDPDAWKEMAEVTLCR